MSSKVVDKEASNDDKRSTLRIPLILAVVGLGAAAGIAVSCGDDTSDGSGGAGGVAEGGAGGEEPEGGAIA